MTDTIKQEILEAEERLRQAMLDSDVTALDELLAPELIFTNHTRAKSWASRTISTPIDRAWSRSAN